jgi:transcriptional regulator with XRE-family HTH domain
MSIKSFEELYAKAEATDSYLTQKASLDFTEELHRQMERQGMTKADLARRIGSSQAYVTKVFRGDVNFTLASMVKLAAAVHARLDVAVTDKEWEVKWFKVTRPAVHSPSRREINAFTPLHATSEARDANPPLAA